MPAPANEMASAHIRALDTAKNGARGRRTTVRLIRVASRSTASSPAAPPPHTSAGRPGASRSRAWRKGREQGPRGRVPGGGAGGAGLEVGPGGARGAVVPLRGGPPKVADPRLHGGGGLGVGRARGGLGGPDPRGVGVHPPPVRLVGA